MLVRDEIIEITKRSGLGMLLEVGGMDKCLEHFTKLVAAKEREACAQLCDDPIKYGPEGEWCAAAIRERGQA